MWLIGDVHANFTAYKKLTKTMDKSIQLGDFGLGFDPKWDKESYAGKEHKFFRGNHDSPEVCRKHPNYLGDYGVTPEGYFYISGALSIDRDRRIEGVSWWADEELNYAQFDDMMKLYCKIKPEIVLSHDCPSLVNHAMYNGKVIHSRTISALNEAFFRHTPKLWVFGHHHSHQDFELEGTRFVCLSELETMQI